MKQEEKNRRSRELILTYAFEEFAAHGYSGAGVKPDLYTWAYFQRVAVPLLRGQGRAIYGLRGAAFYGDDGCAA